MCGRFGLFSPADVIADLFALDDVPDVAPRYNIAPTQNVLAVCQPRGNQPRLALFFSWGLVPAWSKKKDFKLINARSETVAEKPSFHGAFRRRRCLIPADGFYEWKKVGRAKAPYFFRLKDEMPFAIAGIYERSEQPEGHARTTCALITTQANDVLRPIHDRMPVILAPDAFDAWLDPDRHEAADLLPLLQPFPADAMHTYPVSKAVNHAGYDAPECVAPIETNGACERRLFES